MKKILLKVVLILLVVAIDFCMVTSVANAMTESSIELYYKGDLPSLILYDSEYQFKEKYVYAKTAVLDSPAYCLNQYSEGVTQENEYSVNIENHQIVDDQIWKAIINGYPYKKPSELGCLSDEEAFAATQEAVYAIKAGYSTEKYEGVGEEGQRVVNAMKQILENAKNSTEVLTTNEFEINQQENWDTDEVDSNYLSKTYSLNASSEIFNYSVSIDSKGNVPEGIKIVDSKNEEKCSFESSDQFKILLPKDNIELDTYDFQINVTATLKSNHVYYGAAPDGNWQNYAILKQYENAENSVSEQYTKPKEEAKSEEEIKEQVKEETSSEETEENEATENQQSEKLPQTGF